MTSIELDFSSAAKSHDFADRQRMAEGNEFGCFLAAMMPAMRAVARTSPFLAAPARMSCRVSGFISTMRLGGGEARRDVLCGHVDHAGGAVVVEMGEAVMAVVRMARVAAATSAWRIRLSPMRKALTPTLASLARSAGVKRPLSPTIRRSLGMRGRGSGGLEACRECVKIAVVDADEPGGEAQCAIKLRF